MARLHDFPADSVHYTWDASNAPVLTVESGDSVVVETRDVTDGQVGPGSDASAITAMDWDRVYPLAGPIAVAGAEPGDTLAVEVLEIEPRGWGFVAIIPGLGLLPDDFAEAHIRVFDLSGGDECVFRDDIRVPLAPFLGTMGVCPAGAAARPVMPPGTFGGNLDTRQLMRGTTLFLPVELPGALFSCGDGHGAQGDGEICVTGLEAPLRSELRFTLLKGKRIPAPQFRTAGALTPRVDHAGFYGTTGVGPDLFVAAQEATRAMVAHLT